MRTAVHSICLMLLVLTGAPAAIVIQQFGNAYGLRPTNSVHSGVARGGLLGIVGDQLGPDAAVSAEDDPEAGLAGVTVVLTMPDGSYPLPLTYVSRNRVVAFVPTEVSPGSGAATISYAGSSSSKLPVRIVDATFGIATQLETGFGPAFASNLSGDTATLNTLLNPVRPGQRLMLYGTGLGVTGEPPIIWVGNFQANMINAGPTGCCQGTDQIQIVIPEGIEGCYVPVAVQIGQTMSNFVSLAVASGDGPCSDPLSFTREELERISTLDKVRLGAITVDRHGGSDLAQAKFVEYDRDAFLRSVSVFGMPPFGTCTVNPQVSVPIFTQPGQPMDERDLGEPNGLINRLLDAGPRLSATNVAGFFTLNPVIDLTMHGGGGLYYGLFVDPSRFDQAYPLNSGSLQAKGAGGRDVGAFQADQRFNPGIGLTSQSFDSSNWIPGVPSPQIFWTESVGIPVEPPRYSEIQLLGGQVMLCTVAPGIGTFQVPGFVTLGAALSGPRGQAYIQPVGPRIGLEYPPARFSAEGIDIGVFFSRSFNF